MKVKHDTFVAHMSKYILPDINLHIWQPCTVKKHLSRNIKSSEAEWLFLVLETPE